MRTLLVDMLHIYVLVVMGAFVISCLLAATGSFDSWGKRYIRNRSGRKIYPDKSLR